MNDKLYVDVIEYEKKAREKNARGRKSTGDLKKKRETNERSAMVQQKRRKILHYMVFGPVSYTHLTLPTILLV